MVGPDGALPLPWIATPLQEGLRRQGHAFLVHGPEGVGQFELAVTLAQGWLCEAVEPAAVRSRPCGICAGCRLIQARSHPDLLVLLPEALREPLGWAGGPAEGEEGAASKAKPSKEIKVDAVRAAVAFAQTTSARGRGKVVVLHPAERVNAIASNTLLKTLEEPPGAARFLLSCSTPDALLPTIRSRCQVLPLPLPPTREAVDWLQGHGVAEPATLLAACGGQPQMALQWAREGVDARLWSRLPKLLAEGEAAPFLGWPLPRLVDALQKLCHDAFCVASGVAPRYFPAAAVPAGATLGALNAWSRSLGRIAANAEHPWSAGLMVEALVEEARRALGSRPEPARRAIADSLHWRA
jgi:DNA polymerase-3 subunit delta'